MATITVRCRQSERCAFACQVVNIEVRFAGKNQRIVVFVLPVVAIVLILCCTPLVDLTSHEVGVFALSSLFLVLGIGLFNLGADVAMSPMGEQIGSGLTKSRKLSVLLSVCFAMGVLITVAEPDLSVLSNQIAEKIPPLVLILAVGVGVGAFLLLGVLKTVLGKSLAPI